MASVERDSVLRRVAPRAVPAALLVIGTIAAYHWTVAPQASYLHAIQRLGPVVDHIAAENDRLGRSLDLHLGDLQRTQREWAEVREKLLTRAETTAFLRGLSSRVEETGCAVLMVDFHSPEPGKVREPEPTAGVGTQRTRLTVCGTFDQIAVLLQRLQRNPPRVWVESLRLERSGSRPDPVRGPEAERFKCQMTIALYTIAEPVPSRP